MRFNYQDIIKYPGCSKHQSIKEILARSIFFSNANSKSADQPAH